MYILFKMKKYRFVRNRHIIKISMNNFIIHTENTSNKFLQELNFIQIHIEFHENKCMLLIIFYSNFDIFPFYVLYATIDNK